MVETKCTEKKVRDGADFLLEWLYRHQGANYCHAYGLELGERVEVVRYPVLFYRGDWRGSGPVAVEYTVRFAPAELKQSWNMLLVNKQATERELASASVSSVNVVNTEPKLIA
jgi:hypothetical protein